MIFRRKAIMVHHWISFSLSILFLFQCGLNAPKANPKQNEMVSILSVMSQSAHHNPNCSKPHMGEMIFQSQVALRTESLLEQMACFIKMLPELLFRF